MKIPAHSPMLVIILAASSIASGAWAQSATAKAGAPGVEAQQPSRAQQLMGDISPKMVQLTDELLFGDIWERPQLSKRDRSLVTVSALITMNRPDQMRSHMTRARQNGVTQEELVETITHLAFYTGWPNAVSAIAVAREVFKAEAGTLAPPPQRK